MRQDGVDIHLAHHGVDVHLAHDRVDIETVDDCGDVDLIDDGLDVHGPDQRVDVDTLAHKCCEVQAVEHLVHHRWDHGRDDAVELTVGGCPRFVAAVGEGLDDAARVQAFIQEGRMHDYSPDGAAARVT